MDSITEYFQMGGYAAYVWPALGLTATILILMLAVSLLSLRNGDAVLRDLEAARGPRRSRRGSTAQQPESQA